MLPASVAARGEGYAVWAGVGLGILALIVLEQILWWHHCYRSLGEHRLVGYLVLDADGLHKSLGGLAVGATFVLDVHVGIVIWLVGPAAPRRRDPRLSLAESVDMVASFPSPRGTSSYRPR